MKLKLVPLATFSNYKGKLNVECTPKIQIYINFKNYVKTEYKLHSNFAHRILSFITPLNTKKKSNQNQT